MLCYNYINKNEKGIKKIMKKLLVGLLVTSMLVINYVFPTTITTTEYGIQIEFFNQDGYFIEY